ncbi:MAG: Maff2 family protein [Oscillospiraceae bacterium]|nr:Maff2 family protein [Oscillospiraceae bacterium]
MEFFTKGINIIGMIIIAVGAGLGIFGIISLFDGYSNDDGRKKESGMKQLIAGAGIAIVGTILIPLLGGMLDF